jgi:hypothetical protein
VELSSKEGKSKLAEQTYKQKTKSVQGCTDDSPIQNLRDPATWQKDRSKT